MFNRGLFFNWLKTGCFIWEGCSMGPIVEFIAAFVAGIVTMPFLSEGYVFLRKQRLYTSYTKRNAIARREHLDQVQDLTKKWNDTLEAYNKKLSKMEMKLKRHGLVLESDEDNNQVVVKKGACKDVVC